ncbi:hypothetical protein [Williamsia phyllosphaerae]|uniref:Head-to-tail adaptor n=1 Tax=Williamsia phyllosphaerae TaxID=885042 RepID=A0ABQ1V4V0_9NOCA|nr:hypothetical protein [Williamsia phyllosphaerae]GGF39083.1 hypothetical protein GCM10007298_38480 [Williamsia phyllosphaerae]
MPAVVFTADDDLKPFVSIDGAKADIMIRDALALAARVAPCILDDDFPSPDAAKAIIRGAILRWNDAGSGSVTQKTAGPYGVTVDSGRKSMFWPSEIKDLQRLCPGSSTGGRGRAHMVDMFTDPDVA